MRIGRLDHIFCVVNFKIILYNKTVWGESNFHWKRPTSVWILDREKRI